MRAVTIGLAVALAAGAAAPAVAGAAQKRPRTWYVKAASPGEGRGTARAPFRRLGAVERASRPGDRIVVLPTAGTLDGGLALKPRQRLRGAGMSVDGGPRAGALVRYDVSVRRAWWGSPGGPAPGRVVAAGGSLDSGEPRASAEGC